MKHLRLLAFVLLWPASVLADYQAGVDAFAQGDYATAYREFLPLVEQEDADAQFNLALMYSNGVGVPQDYAEALKWYRLAAEQGLAKAQFNLGVMYYKGEGVLQDYVQASAWWKLSAIGRSHLGNPG